MHGQKDHRSQVVKNRFLQLLMEDKAKVDKFNAYQPAVILFFLVGFVLMSVASIYGAVRLGPGQNREVILGTNFTGWALMVFTIIFYIVSLTGPYTAYTTGRKY